MNRQAKYCPVAQLVVIRYKGRRIMCRAMTSVRQPCRSRSVVFGGTKYSGLLEFNTMYAYDLFVWL